MFGGLPVILTYRVVLQVALPVSLSSFTEESMLDFVDRPEWMLGKPVCIPDRAKSVQTARKSSNLRGDESSGW